MSEAGSVDEVHDRIQRVAELANDYERLQADAVRRLTQGPAQLRALAEAVRVACIRDGHIDADAVAALHDRTGLNFRVEEDAVVFELRDDKNPGRTQSVAVRAAAAKVE